MKEKVNYIDKEKFLNAISTYRKNLEHNKESENDELLIYISDCFDKLATRISYHRYFRNYSFRDDLVAEAKLACWKAFKKGYFDHENRDNPFAYFTTVCYNAFRLYQKKDLENENTKKLYLEKVLDKHEVQETDENSKFYKNVYLNHIRKIRQEKMKDE